MQIQNLNQLYLSSNLTYWNIFVYNSIKNGVSIKISISIEIADNGGLIPALTNYKMVFYKGYLNTTPDLRKVAIDVSLPSYDSNTLFAQAIRMIILKGGYVEFERSASEYHFLFKYRAKTKT